MQAGAGDYHAVILIVLLHANADAHFPKAVDCGETVGAVEKMVDDCRPVCEGAEHYSAV